MKSVRWRKKGKEIMKTMRRANEFNCEKNKDVVKKNKE